MENCGLPLPVKIAYELNIISKIKVESEKNTYIGSHLYLIF